jgi:signal transduction histidine kinase
VLQQFAYVASHDLQEPLRKVTGYVEVLEADHGDQLDEQAREYMRLASNAAHRMRQLINDLLALSRVREDGMRVADCDTRAAVDEIVDDFEVVRAVVAKIVANHGGRIWATSEPGAGTMIEFILPAEPARQP